MLCVSDCIIASVGSIKSKDCLCIVATINVTHSFLKCAYDFKNAVSYDIISKPTLFDLFFLTGYI